MLFRSLVPRDRLILAAQKARLRIGGTGNLLEPFPLRPATMNREKYERLAAKAIAAEQRLKAALSGNTIGRK